MSDCGSECRRFRVRSFFGVEDICGWTFLLFFHTGIDSTIIRYDKDQTTIEASMLPSFPINSGTKHKKNSSPGSICLHKTGDTLTLRQMLNEGVPVDAAEEDGKTLLMKASAKGDLAQINSYRSRCRCGAKSNKGILHYIMQPVKPERSHWYTLRRLVPTWTKRTIERIIHHCRNQFFHNPYMTRYLVGKRQSGWKGDKRIIVLPDLPA